MSRLDVSLTSYDYGPPYAGATPTSHSSSNPGWYTISTTGAPGFTVQGPNGLFPGLFAIPNHGLADGTKVIVSVINGTSAYAVGVTYFVRTTAPFVGVTAPSPFDKANTFYLSATAGGNPIVPTDNNGAGILFTPATNATHTIFLAPQRYGESWVVSRATIQNSSQIKVPSASVYRGVISIASLVDTTPNGIFNTDDFSSPIDLVAGEPLIVQFVGCDPPTPTAYVTSTVYLTGDTNR